MTLLHCFCPVRDDAAGDRRNLHPEAGTPGTRTDTRLGGPPVRGPGMARRPWLGTSFLVAIGILWAGDRHVRDHRRFDALPDGRKKRSRGTQVSFAPSVVASRTRSSPPPGRATSSCPRVHDRRRGRHQADAAAGPGRRDHLRVPLPGLAQAGDGPGPAAVRRRERLRLRPQLVARDIIGSHDFMRFVPYLVTVFFFMLLNNLFGVDPVHPVPDFSGPDGLRPGRPVLDHLQLGGHPEARLRRLPQAAVRAGRHHRPDARACWSRWSSCRTWSCGRSRWPCDSSRTCSPATS